MNPNKYRENKMAFRGNYKCGFVDLDIADKGSLKAIAHWSGVFAAFSKWFWIHGVLRVVTDKL